MGCEHHSTPNVSTLTPLLSSGESLGKSAPTSSVFPLLLGQLNPVAPPPPPLAEDSPELVCTASGPWQEGGGVSTVGSYH